MLFAGVAQLVRALPCHGRGCRFKSGRSRKEVFIHTKCGVINAPCGIIN